MALPDSPDTTTIYSLKKVTVAIEDLLLGLLNCDITGESQLRRFVEQQTQQRVEQSVFHHLLNKLKAQIGVAQRSGETGEFKQLLLWCVTDISVHDAYARFDVTENHEICRLLYMSRDMRHNFERNGRHVLSLNHRLHLTPFLRSQIGQRWLLSYMPPTDYTPLRILPSDPTCWCRHTIW